MDLFEDIRTDSADIALALRGHRVLTGELDNKGRYTTRVSGGTCSECGYEKLHDGTCGVCAAERRVQATLKRTETFRQTWKRKRGAA